MISTENLTENSWRRLIKDFDVPFTFISRQQAQDAFNCMVDLHVARYQTAINMVQMVSNMEPADQDSFFSEVSTTMNQMIDFILKSDGYAGGDKDKCFNTCDIQKMFPLPQVQYPSGDIYNHEHVGGKFVSIDLKNAAFQMFLLWDHIHKDTDLRVLPDNVNCYRDFVSAFTSDSNVVEYITECKRLRQVILGKTNPKRLMHMEKWLMYNLADMIGYTTGLEPVKLNNDEIIYEYDRGLEPVIEAFETRVSFRMLLTEDMQGNILDVNDDLIFQHGDTVTNITVDVSTEVFVLREFSLCQTINTLLPSSHTRFYGKDRYTNTRALPMQFKCLPSNLEMIAMACMQEDTVLQNKIEALPQLNGNIVVFVTDPYSDVNCWSLQETYK